MLQDNVRLMQGQVKQHEERPVATVRMLKPDDDYGFLETSDGREVYFHRNSVLNGGFGSLKPGARGQFHRGKGREGAAGQYGKNAPRPSDAVMPSLSRRRAEGVMVCKR